jgi:uncharacterized protein (TIGR00369 family)
MKRKVLRKQYNTHDCMVCGLRNRSGLQARFYELEGGEVAGVFRPSSDHQGYPGRLHGGILSSLLDETIARAVNVKEPEVWSVTMELKVRYRKPVPMMEEVHAIGRVTRDTRRVYEGSAEIVLPDGTVAVEATGRFMKLPFASIADFDLEGRDWQAEDPLHERDEIDLPQATGRRRASEGGAE